MSKRKLTREQIWALICKGYPSMRAFSIGASFNDKYISRPELSRLLIELNVMERDNISEEEKKSIREEIVGLL